MRQAVFRIVALASLAVSVGAPPIGAQQPPRAPASTPSKNQLPPVSYVCPMPGDEDILEDKPGSCPRCGMELEGIRLDTVYTCLTNTAIVREQPGKCPTDGRPLVPMTMAVSFVCPGAPDSKESINPGTCPDGTAKQRKYSPRPHGNHNPQHGGGFFMAPDNWHHLEGAYYSTGTFRLYLYDDFTRPLPLADVRAAKARLILKDGKDIPLVRNGRFLEAKVGTLPLPLSVQTKVKFKDDAPENQFDFTFEKYSVDVPSPPAATTTLAATPASAPAARPPTAAAAAPPGPPTTPATPSPVLEAAPGADPGLVSAPIPDTVPEMLAQLKSRNDQIKAYIDRGSFAAVYVPAFQAKDVALALDAKKGGLPADRQRQVTPAVDRLVKSAYLLDAFGDLGNKQQIIDAYARFATAVQEINVAFEK
jgi:Heavy metal binding domain